jgi:hypothetical protein
MVTIQYLKYLKGSLASRKILRHVTSGFTSHSVAVIDQPFEDEARLNNF